MQKREDFKQLFGRYRAGQCTPEEEARLHAWFNRYVEQEASGLEELEAAYKARQPAAHRQWYRWLPYVAAILTGGIIAFGLLRNNPKVIQRPVVAHVASADVMPGGNKATLTLADGRMVNLSETQKGIVVGDGIRYLDGSEVMARFHQGTDVAEKEPSGYGKESSHIQYYVLATPRGGTYQLTLPDGSRVWLNASSTLRYPSRFDGHERIVEIDGEGYFSVARDESKPFKVVSKGQEIEVLGTAFNLSAYTDDGVTKTTLVEGAVLLRSGTTAAAISLLAGEQGLLTNGYLSKRKVETEPYIAWKEGSFYFENTPFADMMRQVSRWYDVEVVYEHTIPQELFSGAMSRSVTLQTVLELLRISEIKYRIDQNKLIIE